MFETRLVDTDQGSALTFVRAQNLGMVVLDLVANAGATSLPPVDADEKGKERYSESRLNQPTAKFGL